MQQTPLSDVNGLSKPAQRALHNAGFDYAEELAAVKATDLSDLHGIGPAPLRVLSWFLQSAGLDVSDPS